MKMKCLECKVKSEDGILEHLEGCSAVIPKINTQRPGAATELIFDSPEEREKFMRNLTGSAGGSVAVKKSGEQSNVSDASQSAQSGL